MVWRKLFGKTENPEPTSAEAAQGSAATPTFAVDRDRMFDLDLTSRLHQLFAVPRDSRDERWSAAFFPALWNASLEIADPPFFQGPDGFTYGRLQLPQAGAPFDSNSLANQARMLVERGFGAAIFAAPGTAEPDYVLPMGVIDSLLRFDTWHGDPLDRNEVAPGGDPVFARDDGEPGRLVATRDHQMLIGTPSPTFLPPYVARALYWHLTKGWGITDPRVALLVDPSAAPPRSLMLDRRPEDFPNPESIEPRVRMLLWYLPPRSSIVLRPDSVAAADMTPLSSLFPADLASPLP